MTLNSRISWELGYAEEAESTFHGINTVDDLEAIKDFFARSQDVTPEATRIKDEFNTWYDKLWWVEKTTQANFDLARNMRNKYNLANVKTAAEKQAVVNSIKQGLSAEQMVGEPDRRLSDGIMLPGPTTPPKDPLIPRTWLIAGGVVTALAVVVAAHGAATGLVRP